MNQRKKKNSKFLSPSRQVLRVKINFAWFITRNFLHWRPWWIFGHKLWKKNPKILQLKRHIYASPWDLREWTHFKTGITRIARELSSSKYPCWNVSICKESNDSLKSSEKELFSFSEELFQNFSGKSSHTPREVLIQKKPPSFMAGKSRFFIKRYTLELKTFRTLGTHFHTFISVYLQRNLFWIVFDQTKFWF